MSNTQNPTHPAEYAAVQDAYDMAMASLIEDRRDLDNAKQVRSDIEDRYIAAMEAGDDADLHKAERQLDRVEKSIRWMRDSIRQDKQEVFRLERRLVELDAR